jgi:hypothetical protein
MVALQLEGRMVALKMEGMLRTWYVHGGLAHDALPASKVV